MIGEITTSPSLHAIKDSTERRGEAYSGLGMNFRTMLPIPVENVQTKLQNKEELSGPPKDTEIQT